MAAHASSCRIESMLHACRQLKQVQSSYYRFWRLSFLLRHAENPLCGQEVRRSPREPVQSYQRLTLLVIYCLPCESYQRLTLCVLYCLPCESYQRLTLCVLYCLPCESYQRLTLCVLYCLPCECAAVGEEVELLSACYVPYERK